MTLVHRTMVLRVLLFSVAYTAWMAGIRFISTSEISTQFIALNILSGVLLASVLVYAFSGMLLRRRFLFVLTWFVLFMVGYLINYVEAYFFTTVFSGSGSLIIGILRALLTSFVEAFLAVLFLYQVSNGRGLLSEISAYLQTRTTLSWVKRIIAGSIVYLPIYFFFGMLIMPFVMPYYAHSSFLVIPAITTLLPLEILRGFLYVVTFLPVIAIIHGSWRKVSLVTILLLYIPGALIPLLVQPSLPPQIIPFHLLEILGDSIVYGLTLTYLFGHLSMKE